MLDKPRKVDPGDSQSGSLLGPRFSADYIRELLDRKEVKYEEYEHEFELVDRVARLIGDEKVIGWFQGKMEFGPRALGSPACAR